MKKEGLAIICLLFISMFAFFISAEGNNPDNNLVMSNQENSENNGQEEKIGTQNQGEDKEIQNEIKSRNILTTEEITKITQTKNRIGNGECPVNCTCEANITRCKLMNQTRNITILAGNSGNVIIQTKDINASTNVSLYNSNGKFYGNFENETREINILPDQVQERIRERLLTQLQNETILLNENGTYQYQAQQRAKLFSIFSLSMNVDAEIDSETGEVITLKKPWWAFLASEDKEE